MKPSFAEFRGIRNSFTITEESDFIFLYHLQAGLLLALYEQGILTAMEYRRATEQLKQLLRNRIRENGRKRECRE